MSRDETNNEKERMEDVGMDNSFEGSSRDKDQDEKDKKVFSRRRTCWYCAKKTRPDWKKADSFLWLVNEFGKISPARVSGLCCAHQRKATAAIKRSRFIGLIGAMSNEVTR